MMKIEKLNQFKDLGKNEKTRWAEIQSIIIYESPIDRIFTNCEHSIKVWNDSGKHVKNLNIHQLYVSCLLRWDIDVMLSSSFDGSILQISTKDLSVKRKILEPDRYRQVFEIHKLTEDLLLSFDDYNVEIISFSKCQVIKRLENVGKYFYTINFGKRSSSRVKLSLTYPNSFFLNKETSSLFLVNYENDERKEFSLENVQKSVHRFIDSSKIFLENFMNKQKEEILIFGFEAIRGKILIFKVGRGEDNKNENEHSPPKNKDFKLDLIQNIRIAVSTLCVIENKYLCVGTVDAKFVVFGKKKKDSAEYSHLHSSEPFSDGLKAKSIIYKVSNSEHIDLFFGMHSVSSGEKKQIEERVFIERFRINGLALDNRFENEDLAERIGFLRNPNIKKELFFGEYNLIFCNVKLMNLQFSSIFRFLFV